MVTLWLKYLKGRTISPGNLIQVGITMAKIVKGGTLSPEELVRVGTTVVEVGKVRCFKSRNVSSCWYHCD